MADENQENGLHFDLPKNRSSVIKVIGVGGGGSNAVNHMMEMGIKGVDFMVCNTDAQALEHSTVKNRIQLGATLTEGLGAGANPDVGRESATESLEEIREVLKHNTRMVFITAGMGGGTGTGAAPVIAKLAREMNILTVAIVTKPFRFEGKIRAKQAQAGIDILREHVDSLVVINNDKLREVYGNLSFRSGFAKADEVLANAAKGIAEVITYHYTTNIDLRDVRTVLENSGTAIMGSSIAGGENRANNAVRQALDSPLLNDNNINGAKNVLLLIVSGTGGQEITMDEMSLINEHIQDEAGGNANVIMGIGIDDKLEEKISVTVIATGFPQKQHDALSGHTPNKIVHPLNEDQPIEKDIFERPFAQVESPEKRLKTYSDEQPDLFSAVAPKPAVVHDLYEEETKTETPETEAKAEVTEEFDLVDEMEDEKQEETVTADVAPQQTAIVEEEKAEDFSFDMQEETDEAVSKITLEIEEEEEEEFQMEVDVDVDEEEKTEDFSENFEIEADEEVTFELDDIEGDGIELRVENTTKTPDETRDENTDYDPFDFRIDEVMGAAEEEQPKKIELEETQVEAQKEEEKISVAASASEPKIVRHTLEDLIEFQKNLEVKKPQEQTKNEVKKTVEPKEEKEELLNFAVSVKETTSNEVISADLELDTDIINTPIGPASRKKILERKERLEQYSYKFRTTRNKYVDNEPAFKRQGYDIGADNYSNTNNVSKMTISGKGNETEIKTNNSFLHDNVD